MLSNKPVRLIIADDHDIMREGLVSLLRDVPGLEIVGQTHSGQGAIELVQRHRPDIALLDITMDDMTGFEAMGQFAPLFPDVKVIILTIHEDKTFFFEALQAGAHGYFLKGSHSQELVNAIQAVYKGGIYLPPKLAGGLVQDWMKHLAHPEKILTPREKEILALIGSGLTDRKISEKLDLNLNTVKTHRLNIYRKLNLHDRASLVDYALRRGLIQATSDNQPDAN